MGQQNTKSTVPLSEKRYKIERPGVGVKKKVSTVSTKSRSREVSTDENSSSNACPVIKLPPPDKDDSPPVSIPRHAKHFLSRRERTLLEQSWKKTRKTGSEHVGSKIFFMVLTSQPDIKAIFGLEKIPQGRLKYDPRFRQHATVFTKTFDYVIKNIDFPDKLETHFESLGRRHVVLQGRGFDPHYWEIFAECMTQAAVEWEANRQRPTLGAWRTLVSTIIMFMRRGFDEENNKRRMSSMASYHHRSSSCINSSSPRSVTPTF